MPYYFVWESEYPEEGSELVKASTAEEAKEEWMRLTNCQEKDTQLTTHEATAERLLDVHGKLTNHIARVAVGFERGNLGEAMARLREVDAALKVAP